MAKISKESETFMQGLIEAFRTGGMAGAISNMQKNANVLESESRAESSRLAESNYKATQKAKEEQEKKNAKAAKPDAQ